MKLEEVLNEWVAVIKNKDGKERRFKNADSPEAIKFKDSGKGPKTALGRLKDTVGTPAYERTVQAEARRKARDNLANEVENAISGRFPDGWWGDDSKLKAFLKKWDFTLQDAEKEFKKVHRQTVDQYWEQLEKDYDAGDYE